MRHVKKPFLLNEKKLTFLFSSSIILTSENGLLSPLASEVSDIVSESASELVLACAWSDQVVWLSENVAFLDGLAARAHNNK